MSNEEAKAENKTLPNVVEYGDRNHEKYLRLLNDLNTLISGYSAMITLFVDGEIQLPSYMEERLKQNDAYFEPDEAEKLEDSLYALRAILFSDWIDYDNLVIHLEENIRNAKESRKTTVE